MSALPILGLFSAFLLGGLLAKRAAGSRLPDPAVMLAGMTTLFGYLFLSFALPFHGAWGEIPVIASAALVFAPAMVLAFRNQTRVRDNALLFAARQACVFFGFALVLFTLPLRLGYCHKLGWECNGRIIEVSRGGNRRSPRIVVEGAGGRIDFEGVGPTFGNRAAPGMTLIKKAGSPTALLDGTAVRMLEPVGFWNDPP